jgi:hypothetical protein
LETVFDETLARLHSEPLTVTVEDETGRSHEVTIDDLKFLNYVLNLGVFGNDIVRMPAGIMTIHNGDYAPVAQGWLGWLAGRHGETGPGAWANSLGIYFIDGCLQEKATGAIDQSRAAYADADSLPSLRDWVRLVYIEDWFVHCEFWGPPPAPGSGIGEPVTSDVPTLITVNTLDPYTAPYFTDATIQRFSQGYRFELPTAHISALLPCGADLMAQFLTDPSRSPDASCIQEMTMDWVLPED